MNHKNHVHCSCHFDLLHFAQPTTKFRAFIVQANDTLDVKEGLINFDPIRFSWIQSPGQKVKSVDVTLAMGLLPIQCGVKNSGR
jgi:hypothetical protein